jgi:phage terminase large subunit-like protein
MATATARTVAAAEGRISAPAIHLEVFQRRAWAALVGPATHVLLYGGARSGKTHLIVLWLVLRALAKPGATHAVLRYRFNHLKTSIIYDTLPAVCESHWPGQKLYTLNKSDWYAEFVGGGRVYFGGLDDKERTEKILGQGHSSIYLNEVSQISFASRLKAVTRLSQSRGLALKEVCDENPPTVGHWTERLWIKGVDPSTGKALADRNRYAFDRMNPIDNPHIPEATKQILRALPPRERARFWDGAFGSGVAQPLWTYESLEAARVEAAPPGLTIGVVIDPSGCSGPEDKRSDEIGVSVVGLAEGVVYVLEDASGRWGPDGDDGWGARAIHLYCKYGADFIAAEKNFGGAMVGAVIRSARAKVGGEYYDGSNVPFREINASNGKHVRAEPVGTLTGVGRVKFVGNFPELEEQLIAFSTAGYTGEKSPDRADAMIHGVHALGITPTPGQGIYDYFAQQAAAALKPDPAPEPIATDLVSLLAPAHITGGTFYTMHGAAYVVESGRVLANPKDVADLQLSGFHRPPE